MSILRDLLEPDDFAARPYEGGLNQAGHVVAGAALAAISRRAAANDLRGGDKRPALEYCLVNRLSALRPALGGISLMRLFGPKGELK